MQEQQGSDLIPQRLSVEFAGEHHSGTLIFEIQTIHDRRESPLFNRLGDIEIGDDNRLYVVDTPDGTVRVLDAEGHHIRNIGRLGQGPGELEQPWLVAVSRSRVFVANRFGQLDVFSTEGTHLATYRFPFNDVLRESLSLNLVGDRLVVTGPSLVADLYGKAVHVFETPLGGSSRELVHVQSLAGIPEVEPRFYMYVSGGTATKDLDDGIIFTQKNPYRVRKFDAQL